MSNGVAPVLVAEDGSEKKEQSLGSSGTDSDTDTESENEQEYDTDPDAEDDNLPSPHSPELKSAKGEGLAKQAQEEIKRIPTQPRTDEGLQIHHVM